jgi:hypothetical protein
MTHGLHSSAGAGRASTDGSREAWRGLARQAEDVVTEGPPDNAALPGKESDSRLRVSLRRGFGMLDFPIRHDGPG